MPNQVIDFIAVLGILGNPENSPRYANFGGLKEWVNHVTEGKEDATEHPDINFIADLELQKGVHNLWWSVHGRCILFHFVCVIGIVLRLDLLEIYSLVGTGSKITNFVISVLADKHILYLDVSMDVSGGMDCRYAIGDALHDT